MAVVRRDVPSSATSRRRGVRFASARSDVARLLNVSGVFHVQLSQPLVSRPNRLDRARGRGRRDRRDSLQHRTASDPRTAQGDRAIQSSRSPLGDRSRKREPLPPTVAERGPDARRRAPRGREDVGRSRRDGAVDGRSDAQGRPGPHRSRTGAVPVAPAHREQSTRATIPVHPLPRARPDPRRGRGGARLAEHAGRESNVRGVPLARARVDAHVHDDRHRSAADVPPAARSTRVDRRGPRVDSRRGRRRFPRGSRRRVLEGPTRGPRRDLARIRTRRRGRGRAALRRAVGIRPRDGSGVRRRRCGSVVRDPLAARGRRQRQDPRDRCRSRVGRDLRPVERQAESAHQSRRRQPRRPRRVHADGVLRLRRGGHPHVPGRTDAHERVGHPRRRRGRQHLHRRTGRRVPRLLRERRHGHRDVVLTRRTLAGLVPSTLLARPSPSSTPCRASSRASSARASSSMSRPWVWPTARPAARSDATPPSASPR